MNDTEMKRVVKLIKEGFLDDAVDMLEEKISIIEWACGGK